ncbi:MAG: hypothetical protein JRJ84_21545 [Deltaproteobacteria bacterium]|nr:hypothetical protein [Deltaproteobacteria bacterium]
MKTRIVWIVVAMAMSNLLPATGCELSECMEGDCSEGPDTENPDTGQHVQHFRYVLIRDLEDSESDSYGTNGVEIDGVELRHGGSANFADHVEFISFGSGETDFQDQNQVLGTPEGTCETEDGNFVSLGGTGGTGGYLVVSFETASGDPQAIMNGDQVVVHECGDTIEFYNVFIGLEVDITGPHWHPCGQTMSGVATCTVIGLPEIPDQ